MTADTSRQYALRSRPYEPFDFPRDKVLMVLAFDDLENRSYFQSRRPQKRSQLNCSSSSTPGFKEA